MKKLELNQMENLEGGDLLDGACAVVGLTDAGIAVRFLIGNPVTLTPWGAGLLAGATIACVGRSFNLW